MHWKGTQFEFEDFIFSYGELNPNNVWVKLAKLVPWNVTPEHDRDEVRIRKGNDRT